LIMAAIVVKKNNLIPFNGKLTGNVLFVLFQKTKKCLPTLVAYNVKFSLDKDDGKPNYTEVRLRLRYKGA
jgi:hypothetical protein